MDYYKWIRPRFGDAPIVFTEIGWSSAFTNGYLNQVWFLNLLPSLLGSVRPANVIWALQHDVSNYFPDEISSLNYLGLRANDGTPKPAWHQAQWLKERGVYETPR
jgi:hypothetical protein